MTVGNVANPNTTGTQTIALGGITSANSITGIIANNSSSTTNGATAVTMNGAGIWTLSGANTYTGATAVSSGILNIANNGALGASSGVTVSSGGALQLSNNVTTSPTVPLTLNGAGFAGNPQGSLENVSGNNTYSGQITLAAAGVVIGADAGSTLTLNGQFTTGGNGLTLTGAGNGSFAAAITSGSFTKTGSGTWTLSAANTGIGTTTVNGGSLQLNDTAAIAVLPSNNNVTLGGGTLFVSGNSTTGAVTQTVGTFALTAGASSGVTLSDANTSTGTSLTTTGALTAPTITSGTTPVSEPGQRRHAYAIGHNQCRGLPHSWAVVVTDASGTGFGSVNASCISLSAT